MHNQSNKSCIGSHQIEMGLFEKNSTNSSKLDSSEKFFTLSGWLIKYWCAKPTKSGGCAYTFFDLNKASPRNVQKSPKTLLQVESREV